LGVVLFWGYPKRLRYYRPAHQVARGPHDLQTSVVPFVRFFHRCVLCVFTHPPHPQKAKCPPTLIRQAAFLAWAVGILEV
jgi:hypothetical protein